MGTGLKSQLYIPTKINVGYQKRSDCFTGQLAYVIYTDSQGVLRKETSWNSWRDKTIEPQEFENVPTSGFVLNKNVERYKWSHFGTNRSYIRIFDNRGFEFEVTPENLIGILMHSDCSKRSLVGEFVYAWHGKELVLLPCDSEEYKQSVEFSGLQGKKILAKELVTGAIYETKKQEKLIYLGKFDWWEWKSKRGWDYGKTQRIRQKKFIFAAEYGKYDCCKKSKDNQKILALDNISSLARQIGGEVSNYAELIDFFNEHIQSSRFVDFKLVPKPFSDERGEPNYSYQGPPLKENKYWAKEGDCFVMYEYKAHAREDYNSQTKERKFRLDLTELYCKTQFDPNELIETREYHSYSGYSSYNNSWNKDFILISDLKKMDFYELYVLLENGKRVKYNQ